MKRPTTKSLSKALADHETEIDRAVRWSIQREMAELINLFRREFKLTPREARLSVLRLHKWFLEERI